MVIRQGDIYWVDLASPVGSSPGYRHPHVVVQNNLFNQSRISTILVCVITSNVKRADAPGNVLLDPEEANLPQRGVVLGSQIMTVDRTQLVEYIGSLSGKRLLEVLDGIHQVIEPYEIE